VLMALAHLAIERPGWDEIALPEIAKQVDPDLSMYDRFKTLHRESIVGQFTVIGVNAELAGEGRR
jgi:hypothetical protein